MIGFCIVTAVLFFLMTAALELNKNVLAAFPLLIAVTGLFVWLMIKVLEGSRWYWKVLSFLGWIACFALIFFLTWPPVKPVPAYEGNTPVRTETVSTKYGDVRGVVIGSGEVELYAGIPYAKPPVGDLRWKEPQEPDTWSGILEADHFAPMCMQPTNVPIYNSLRQIIGYHDYRISLTDNYIPPVDEDGLYLNIWKPAGKTEKLPVLVYIHGGSLQTGQPWYGDYAGKGIAAAENMIVVNFGYRLGVFGFYADRELMEESQSGTTGNYGLLDQILALKWVKENIAAFGGDPEMITVSGESAGSACVSALCTSPLAKGLFNRVIMESSTVASIEPPHSFRLLEDALSSGMELKIRYGVSSVGELRALDAKTLVNEAYTQHHITVDGYVLTETPYESYKKGIHNEQQILHGYNSEESGPFIILSHANLKNYEGKIRAYFGEYADEVLTLYNPKTDEDADKYWEKIYGAVFFTYPHYCLNRLANENGIPVYEYCFSKQNGRLGPWHSGELVYCYGNIPEDSKLFDENDRALSRTVMSYFRNFAVSGDPNGAGLPVWEQSPDSSKLLEWGDDVEMKDEEFLALYAVMDRMQGWN